MVADVAEDKEGNIWVATIIRPNTNSNAKVGASSCSISTTIENANTISSNILNRLAVDEKGNIWIAGQGGLDYLDHRSNTTVKHYRHD
jgi:sugar lactone lactonase YvrE